MSESILKKYLEGNPSSGPEGVRCVNFIRKDGIEVGLCYGHLLWANFDPSKGMQAHFSTHTVTLQGKNLRPLYDLLLRYELTEVLEKDEARDVSSEDETVVTRVLIMQKPDGVPAAFTLPDDSEAAA